MIANEIALFEMRLCDFREILIWKYSEKEHIQMSIRKVIISEKLITHIRKCYLKSAEQKAILYVLLGFTNIAYLQAVIIEKTSILHN